VLTFEASAFGLTATNQAQDLTALLTDTSDNTAGNAVITDVHGDALTLIGVSTSQLKAAPRPRAYLASNAPVGAYFADQLLVCFGAIG
jgi:hypothetical protein